MSGLVEQVHGGVLAALASGELTVPPRRRRAVLRHAHLDEVAEGEQEQFWTEPVPHGEPVRARRAPIGTAHQ